MSLAIDVLNFSDISNQSNVSDFSRVVQSYTDEELKSMELFKEYPKPLLQFAAVCCILFMVIGIPGNLVTIFALSRYEKVRNYFVSLIIYVTPYF